MAHFTSLGRVENMRIWFKNILAQPQVYVQLQHSQFQDRAEPVVDPVRIASYRASFKMSPDDDSSSYASV